MFPFLIFFQNLDVNLAVNNLLSRDEDDGDDDENPEYLPGGKNANVSQNSCQTTTVWKIENLDNRKM